MPSRDYHYGPRAIAIYRARMGGGENCQPLHRLDKAVEIDIGWFRVEEYSRSAWKKGSVAEVQMNTQQLMAKEFHKKFGVLIQSSPRLVDDAIKDRRIRLIREELGEFERAANDKNLVKIADALTDLLYVIFGTGVSYGFDLEPVFKEVCESNMSKRGPEVRVIKGKIHKAKNYGPPDLQPILEKM
jgi:predicted HAD superfamily Cof-like phosphohydrolase